MDIRPLWLDWQETQTLINAFGNSEQLRFVGGAVRDALLERAVQDVDVATILRPEQVMQKLKEAGIKVVPTGIDHGTVTAVIGKHHFEITTLRSDVTTDGRHATVAYTDDWKEDASRRDFTMNALYCDAQGAITDYFNGAQDALAGEVRFIGNAATRIREDALRILRFFRFFAHYGNSPIDREGLAACAQAAATIDNLSGERIQQEMMKLLVSKRAALVVDLMQQNNIWYYVVPCVVNVTALEQLPAVLKQTQYKANPILSLAALLRMQKDRSTLIESILKRWKLSKADSKHLQVLCETSLGDDWNVEKTLKKYIRKLGSTLCLEHVLLLMAEGADMQQALQAIALIRNWTIPSFPVTGDDLLARNILAGVAIGAKLKELENYWEEQDYAVSKKDLLSRL